MISKTFEQLIKEHGEWADATFPKGTSMGALLHAQRECEEIRLDILNGHHDGLPIEYADALFCIMDSARRQGISLDRIIVAGSYKLQINKERQWKDNGDGSYSHIKPNTDTP